MGEGVIFMMEPKYIKLFNDCADELAMLSDEQVGRLLKGLLSYADRGEKPDFTDDITLRVLFSILRKQIDREYEKYDERCQARSAAGRKAAAARYSREKSSMRTDANACVCCQDKDKDNDNDKDNDIDNDIDNDKDIEYGAERAGRASPSLYLPEVDEVVDYLNQRAGTRYRSSAGGTRRLIAALLNEGYDTADMKRVIDSKCAEWLNSEFSRYLRPDVLFGKKFEGYLNAPEPKQTLPKSKLHPWQNDTQDSYLEIIREFEENYKVPGAIMSDEE